MQSLLRYIGEIYFIDAVFLVSQTQTQMHMHKLIIIFLTSSWQDIKFV